MGATKDIIESIPGLKEKTPEELIGTAKDMVEQAREGLSQAVDNIDPALPGKVTTAVKDKDVKGLADAAKEIDWSKVANEAKKFDFKSKIAKIKDVDIANIVTTVQTLGIIAATLKSKATPKALAAGKAVEKKAKGKGKGKYIVIGAVATIAVVGVAAAVVRKRNSKVDFSDAETLDVDIVK